MLGWFNLTTRLWEMDGFLWNCLLDGSYNRFMCIRRHVFCDYFLYKDIYVPTQISSTSSNRQLCRKILSVLPDSVG